MDGHCPSFIHQPLDITRRTIRIIKVDHSTPEDDIRCTLQHVELDIAEYVCLSYAWGAEQPLFEIHINNTRFEVRESLYAFLRRARKLKINAWLWIDAVCIDQTNLSERYHQVRLMGHIYSTAKHVLIYPGEFSRSVDLLVLLISVLRLENRIHFSICRRSILLQKCIHWLERMRFLFLKDFCSLLYWRRMWIVQEVLLARSAYIVSSRSFLDLKHFHAMYSAVVKQGVPYGSTWNLIRLSYQRIVFNKVNPEELLDHTSLASCREQNDRVYALLGCLPTPVNDFPLDYSRPWLLVVLDVVQSFSSQEQWLSQPSALMIFGALAYMPNVLCYDCFSSPAHAVQSREPAGQTASLLADGQSFEIVRTSDDRHLTNSTCTAEHLAEETAYRKDDVMWFESMSCQCCRQESLVGPEYVELLCHRLRDDTLLAKVIRRW